MSQASDDEATSGFAEIPQPRCLELLTQKKSGRVAWNAADGSKILPLTYRYWNGMVVFRTARDGPLAALAHRTRVAFEIDEIDDERETGWSILVRGAASGVTQSYTLSTLWRNGPRTVGRRCPERLHRDHPGIDNRTSRQIWCGPRLIAEGTNVHVRSAALYAGCHGPRAQATNVTFVGVAGATTEFIAWVPCRFDHDRLTTGCAGPRSTCP